MVYDFVELIRWEAVFVCFVVFCSSLLPITPVFLFLFPSCLWAYYRPILLTFWFAEMDSYEET